MGEYTFVMNGKRVPNEETAKIPILVAGLDESDPFLVQGFETRRDCLAWTGGTSRGEQIHTMFDRLVEAQKREQADNKFAERRQKANVKRVAEESSSLSERLDLSIESDELLLKATVEPPPLEGPIFDAAILYDSATFSGAWIPLGTNTFPDLGWFGWNNRASSVRVVGGIFLADGLWLKGRMIMLITYFSWKVTDYPLWPFTFNNIASSAQVF